MRKQSAVLIISVAGIEQIEQLLSGLPKFVAYQNIRMVLIRFVGATTKGLASFYNVITPTRTHTHSLTDRWHTKCTNWLYTGWAKKEACLFFAI